MQLVQNILIVTLMVFGAFWFMGGTRYLKGRKLKTFLHDPLASDEITSVHKRYREQGPLPAQLTFVDYAILRSLNSQDVWAKTAYEKDPESPVAAYFYAGYLLQDIREIRGGAYATKLTEEVKSLLRAKLAEAEQVIQKASQSNPANPDAILMLLEVYLHLGRTLDSRELVEKNVFNLEGRLDVVLKYLRAQYPRWGGSHQLLQRCAQEFSEHGGALLAGKADAFCHLMEDEGLKAYQTFLKANPQDQWLTSYSSLPKAPVLIGNHEDYSLLLAHKAFAKYFLFMGDNKNLKRAIINTSGNFTLSEPINPGAQREDTFYKKALELGVSSFQ